MAKRSAAKKKLSFVDIVMNAEAEDIKKAYEARLEVDQLLAERDEAYRNIARLEEQIEAVIGSKGVFVFAPPPCPVAGMEAASPRRKRSQPASSKKTSKSSAAGNSPEKTDSGDKNADANDPSGKADDSKAGTRKQPPNADSRTDTTTDGSA